MYTVALLYLCSIATKCVYFHRYALHVFALSHSASVCEIHSRTSDIRNGSNIPTQSRFMPYNFVLHAQLHFIVPSVVVTSSNGKNLNHFNWLYHLRCRYARSAPGTICRSAITQEFCDKINVSPFDRLQHWIAQNMKWSERQREIGPKGKHESMNCCMIHFHWRTSNVLVNRYFIQTTNGEMPFVSLEFLIEIPPIWKNSTFFFDFWYCKYSIKLI